MKHKYHAINVPKLRQLYRTRIDSQPYKKLLQIRQQLPVYHHRDAILAKVNRQNVVVIAGETGSGKSTQIPQFMLEVWTVTFCVRNILRFGFNTIAFIPFEISLKAAFNVFDIMNEYRTH